MHLELADKKYPIEVVRAAKRTSSVRIRDGRVVLSLSRYLRGRERERTVEKFLKWARERLEKVDVSDFVEPSYEAGGQVVTHNKIYQINVIEEDRQNVRVKLEDCDINLYFPREKVEQAKIAKLVKREVMKDQQAYLEDVLDELNQLHFQYSYRECRFRDVKSRFGSCSNRGVITLAYRMLFAPREAFRYVCVHELAHLKEFNHSRRFWDLVEAAMPNYKDQEKWLKNKGFLLG